MKILITGAGGFVGKHLIPLLLKRGHQIYAMGTEFVSDERIYAHKADIRDYDAVVHLAAISVDFLNNPMRAERRFL